MLLELSVRTCLTFWRIMPLIFGFTFLRLNIWLCYLPFIPPYRQLSLRVVSGALFQNKHRHESSTGMFFWALVGTVCRIRSPCYDIAHKRLLLWKSPAGLQGVHLNFWEHCGRSGTLSLRSHGRLQVSGLERLKSVFTLRGIFHFMIMIFSMIEHWSLVEVEC